MPRTSSTRTILRLAALALALLPRSTPGDVPPEQAPDPYRYALVAAVRLDEAGSSATYLHQPGPGRLPVPEVAVDLLGQARTAWAVTNARLFLPSTAGAPALRLDVAVGPAAVAQRDGRWLASVTHQVAAVAADGAEVARWTVTGEAEVAGYGPGAVTSTFARAARQAADAFEARFDASPEVAAWLASTGRQRRLPRPIEAAPVDPPRPAWNVYVDGGLGRASGLEAVFRAGVAWRWAFARLGVERWSSEQPFTGVPQLDLVGWLAGVEGGGVVRLGRHLELHGGGGVHWLSASGSLRDSLSGVDMRLPKTGAVGSLLAGATWVTGPRRWLARGRVALEVRRLTGTHLRFDAIGGTATLGPTSILLTLGGELPAPW